MQLNLPTDLYSLICPSIEGRKSPLYPAGIAILAVVLCTIMPLAAQADFVVVDNPEVFVDEDNTIDLGITADPAFFGTGDQLDIVGTFTAYVDAADTSKRVAVPLPANTQFVRITGLGGNGTAIDSTQNEEYLFVRVLVGVESATYSGSIVANDETSDDSVYAFSSVPLGSASNNGIIDGQPSSPTNITVTVTNGGTELVVEGNHTLWNQAYLFEFLSTNSTSADFLGAESAYMEPNLDSVSLTTPSSANYASVSFTSVLGINRQNEDKGLARVIVDLDAGTASGVIVLNGGRGSNETAYAFSAYDLASSLPVLDAGSGAVVTGKMSTNAVFLPNPILEWTGNVLTITRDEAFKPTASTVITVAYYERINVPTVVAYLGSTSSFSELDNHLEPDINTETLVMTLPIPAGAESATLSFSQLTFGSSTTNENTGIGYLLVDLLSEKVSGSLATARSGSPDFVGLNSMPFGVTVDSEIGASVTSNRADAISFMDEYIGVLQFDVVGTFPDLSLQISATVPDFSADYDHLWQADWFGSPPILFQGAGSGTFSSGIADPVSGLWLVQAEHLDELTYTPNEDLAGGPISVAITHGQDLDALNVYVRRVADAPTLTVADESITKNVATHIAGSIDAALQDIDGSEALQIIITLQGEADQTLSDGGANTFSLTENSATTDVDMSNWDLANLTYEHSTPGVYPVSVTVTSTDSDNFTDNQTDPTNLMSSVTDTFELTVLGDEDADGIPDNNDNDGGVTPLVTNITSPIITGFTVVPSDGSLSVKLNGETYTQGDGNLAVNTDGTWVLSLPEDDALEDSQYTVTTIVTDVNGNSTEDLAIDVLTIDTVAPEAPSFTRLTVNNNTPLIEGTLSIVADENLTIEINGVTYTDGDGNLTVSPDGRWKLTIPAEHTLPEGEYSVTLIITDEATNSTTVVSATNLMIFPRVDFDGDGIVDAFDLDSDNDGIPDSVEGQADNDGDGQPNFLDLDSDNDGLFDIIEVGGDDIDNDGRVDNPLDNDNNGLSDELQIAPLDVVDTDGDHVPDFRDLDSDNDGLPDLLENGGVDDDHNGRVDGFVDANGDGADDVFQISGVANLDSDADGVPNYLDLDSDNDGISDLAESGAVDLFSNGISTLMQDGDGDGILDSVDVDFTAGVDTDGDGIDDRFDASFVQEPDTDADGVIDSADADANGDGFNDNPDNLISQGQELPDSVYSSGEFFLTTGVSGYGGCHIGVVSSNDSYNPLFALLIASSTMLVFRRHISQCAS